VTTERVTFMEVKDNENLVNTMILKRAPHILREQLPKKNCDHRNYSMDSF